MKERNDLDFKIESLLEDPEFSRRIASGVLSRAGLRKEEAKPKLFLWQAMAAAVLLGLGAVFATYQLRVEREDRNPYAGLSGHAAESLASPLETEYSWEATDSIIEASFSER